MSARVLTPMMSEPMPRRAPTPAVASTTTPPDAAVARVRRDLFGPVDREATRKFLERELRAQSERDADRWGFDFVREAPRRQGPGTARYSWERVGNADAAVPETYALNRMLSLKSAPAVMETTARQEDAVVANTVEGLVVVAAVEAVAADDAPKNAKQSRITDFMKIEKPRKRRVSLGDAVADECSTSAVVGTPRVKLARSTPS